MIIPPTAATPSGRRPSADAPKPMAIGMMARVFIELHPEERVGLVLLSNVTRRRTLFPGGAIFGALREAAEQYFEPEKVDPSLQESEDETGS